MKTEVVFQTEDHPEANGRKPVKGDVAYELRFPLDDGRELVVNVGQAGFESLSQMVLDMLTHAPSYNDGSTNLE